MNLEPTSLPIDPPAPGTRPMASSMASSAVEQEKLKKVARDFESVFVHQVMSVMKDSIPDDDWEDSSSEQIQGMYWSFLSQAVGEGGGFGMWKELYSTMTRQQKAGSIEPDSDDKPGLDERI